MPLLKPMSLSVSDEDREKLQALVRKHTSPQHLVTRARIILLAGEAAGVHETARRLGVSRTSVQKWRQRWRDSEAGSLHERLADRPRSGAPARYTAEQICAIVALACERPEVSDRPISHWTQQELADEAVARGIVDSISQRSVGRFLKRSQSPTSPYPRVADLQA